MSPVGDLRTNQGVLRLQGPGIHPVQSVPAQIVIAVSLRGCEMARRNRFRPQGVQHTALVDKRDLLLTLKSRLQPFLCRLDQFIYIRHEIPSP